MSENAKNRVSTAAKRPDLGTLAGIAIALSGIIGGLLLEKGKIQDVAQGTAGMIVLGGAFGALLVTTPFSIFRRAIGALGRVFFEQASSRAATMDAIIRYAMLARKNGI